MFENVVFLQGEEATEAFKILDDDGVDAVITYLSRWHDPGKHERNAESCAGKDDNVFVGDDGYRLTYNTGGGYIGLECEIE